MAPDNAKLVIEGKYYPNTGTFQCFGMIVKSAIKENGEYTLSNIEDYGLPFSAQSIGLLMLKIYKMKNDIE